MNQINSGGKLYPLPPNPELAALRAEAEKWHRAYDAADAEYHKFNQWATDELARLRQEIKRLRAALQSIADNPDPLEGKCYCRWSTAVAKQVLEQHRGADEPLSPRSGDAQ